MKLIVTPTAYDAARAAAHHIVSACHRAVTERGVFFLAVSGGRTPELMLECLAALPITWSSVHLLQVDERIAPAEDPARNALQLQRALLERIPVPRNNVHLMPVEAKDPADAATRFGTAIENLLGPEGRLDLIHLGLGEDGHTASLVPGDTLLDAPGVVGLSHPYQGHRRMTLLLSPLNRARERLWLVTGTSKRAALERLQAGDRSIPAGQISRESATIIADAAAHPA